MSFSNVKSFSKLLKAHLQRMVGTQPTFQIELHQLTTNQQFHRIQIIQRLLEQYNQEFQQYYKQVSYTFDTQVSCQVLI
jgi:hypothetical protein